MTHGDAVKIHDAETVMRAHQYLYYVLARPVLLDYTYDKWCDRRGMFGGGGSDKAADYSKQEKLLAEELLKH